jgi:pilus assembly protein CpaE
MQAPRTNSARDVILVEREELIRDTIESYLSGQGVRVVAAVDNVHTAANLIRGIRPGILILEVPEAPAETLEAVRRIRTDYPQLGIIVSSQDSSAQLILRSIRAGAQEFLPRPLDIRELGEAVSRLTLQLDRSENLERRAGEIIAVCSSKGGAGVTSIATNLALALSREPGHKTVLVDLNTPRGDAELMLDMTPGRTLGEVLAASPIDEGILQSALMPYSPELFLLSGPDWPHFPEKIDPMHLVEVFGLLKNLFSYIVVDAGRLLSPHIFDVLGMADLILPVATLDVVSVRNLRSHVRLLQERASADGNIKVVVNRYQKGTSIRLEDLEQATGREVFWKLPNEFKTMNTAINTGNPVLVSAPRSQLARSLGEMALHLTAKEAEQPA